MLICTAASGAPDVASVTRPRMDPVPCANESEGQTRTASASKPRTLRNRMVPPKTIVDDDPLGWWMGSTIETARSSCKLRHVAKYLISRYRQCQMLFPPHSHALFCGDEYH